MRQASALAYEGSVCCPTKERKKVSNVVVICYMYILLLIYCAAVECHFGKEKESAPYGAAEM